MNPLLARVNRKPIARIGRTQTVSGKQKENLRASPTTGAAVLHRRLCRIMEEAEMCLKLAGESANLMAGSPSKSTANIFRRIGQAWYTQSFGQVKCFNDTSGMWHIRYLLEHYMKRPGVPVNVDDMCRNQGEEIASTMAEPAVDQATLASCKKHLKDLERELVDATKCGDGEEVTRLEKEREQVREYICPTINKFGKPRDEGEGGKRRRRVWAALDVAFKAIGQHNPELASHLRQSIETGFECWYQPREPMAWEL